MKRIFFFLIALSALTASSTPPTRMPSTGTIYVCKARSILGRYYSATGTDRAVTQDAAMKDCQAYSRRCYPTGCTSQRY